MSELRAHLPAPPMQRDVKCASGAEAPAVLHAPGRDSGPGSEFVA
jgi:hypothetical protein